MTQSERHARVSQILAAISALTVSLGVTHAGDAASKDAAKMSLSPASTQHNIKYDVVNEKMGADKASGHPTGKRQHMAVKHEAIKMQTIKLTNANAKPTAITVKQKIQVKQGIQSKQ